jgi:chromosome segregation ATPase
MHHIMKSRIIYTAASLALCASFAAVLPAFAQTGENAATAGPTNPPGAPAITARSAALAGRIDSLENRAEQAVTDRIDSLNMMVGRITGMKNLSDSQKTALSTTIQAEIADMNALKTKLQADASTTSLRTDIKSITSDYRIYMVVEPQISILAAADRTSTIVGLLTTLSGKLETRLSQAANASNLASLQADLADMSAKLTDAAAQATAAASEVAGLQPDKGDQTVMQSNNAALKDARSKIQAANKDIQAAYKDAQAIVAGMRGNKPPAASVVPTTTPPTTTQ